MDEFTQAYVECALWSSTDDFGSPLDAKFGVHDLSPECLAKIVDDCKRFQVENADDIANGRKESRTSFGTSDIEYAGHDFWLTRNGHGAGFWDGDWQDDVGERLTKASKAFGECNLYIGDDGKIYC